MKINFLQKNDGFTLVETLVAISIFTMSILALISILGAGISNTTYAKQKLAGTYLAQEGIEYMRNMRDTYVLYDGTSAQAGWDAFKAKLTSGGCFNNTNSGCYFDDQNLNYGNPSQPITGITMTACGINCPALLYGATGKYGYASGVNSGFIRKIVALQINADQIKIISAVSWPQGTGRNGAVFSEYLFNWVE